MDADACSGHTYAGEQRSAPAPVRSRHTPATGQHRIAVVAGPHARLRLQRHLGFDPAVQQPPRHVCAVSSRPAPEEPPREHCLGEQFAVILLHRHLLRRYGWLVGRCVSSGTLALGHWRRRRRGTVAVAEAAPRAVELALEDAAQLLGALGRVSSEDVAECAGDCRGVVAVAELHDLPARGAARDMRESDKPADHGSNTDPLASQPA